MMSNAQSKDLKANQKAPPPAATDSQKKLRLAELLARSMEDDAITLEEPSDRERWDDDEGSFGG